MPGSVGYSIRDSCGLSSSTLSCPHLERVSSLETDAWIPGFNGRVNFVSVARGHSESKSFQDIQNTKREKERIQARPGLHAFTIAIIHIIGSCWFILAIRIVRAVIAVWIHTLPSRHHVHTPHELQYAFAFYFLCKTQLSLSPQTHKAKSKRKKHRHSPWDGKTMAKMLCAAKYTCERISLLP